LRIEVTDTGPGVAAEKRQHLFHEFERLGPADMAMEGAGLGLAISAGLVQAMGGAVGYLENAGGGSLFWLELPAPGEADRVAEVATKDRSAAPVPDHPLRILVVDDAAMNRDVAQSFLLAAGYRVTCAEDGAEAVTLAEMGDFDVILMDVRMPGMDGLEATRRIRRIDGSRGQVPVMALTAQTFAEQVAACRNAGMDGHLAKPFTQEALLGAIGCAMAVGANRVLADFELSGGLVDTTARTPEDDLPIFNQAGFEHTAVFLPPDAVATYLQSLAARAAALLLRLREPEALKRDPTELTEAVHAMAGSAGMFGFDRLAASARSLEQAMRAGTAETPVWVGRLILVLEASIMVVRQHPSVASHFLSGQPADSAGTPGYASRLSPTHV
jgi:CheY-like chemotaxis protein